MTSDRLIRVDDKRLTTRMKRSYGNAKWNKDNVIQTKLFRFEHVPEEEFKSYGFPWYAMWAFRVTELATGKVYIVAVDRGIQGEYDFALFMQKE